MAWLPAILMSALGASYLADCLQASLAPGRGFELVYEGKDGNVLVTADSYSVDILNMTVNFNGLKVRAEGDRGLVRADKVLATQRGTAWKVKVLGATADIVRDKSGLFSALRLLPPEKPGQPGPSVEATVDRLDVVYRDETAAPLTESFALQDIHVTSADPAVIAGGTVVWPDAGSVELSVWLPKEGKTQVQATTGGFDLAKVKDAVERFLPDSVDLKPYGLEAKRADFIGSVTAALEGDKAPELTADGSFIGDGVSVKGYLQNASITGKAKYAAGMVTGDVTSQEAGRKVAFEGGISTEGPLRVVGRVKGDLSGTGRIWPEVAKMLPKELSAKELSYQGTVDVKGQDLATSGTFKVGSVAFAKERASGLSGTVAYRGNTVSAKLDTAKYEGYPVTGWMEADLKDGGIKGAFDGKGENLDTVLAHFGVKGIQVKGEPQVLVSGSVKEPKAAASLNGFVTAIVKDKAYKLGFADLRARFEGSTLTLERAVVAGQYGVASLDGEVRDFGKDVDLGLEVGDINFAAIDPKVSGFSRVKGRVRGSVDDWAFDGSASAFDVQYDRYQVPQAGVDLHYSAGVLHLDKLVARLGLGQVTGDGSYTFESQEITFQGSAKDLFTSDYTDLPVFGQVNVPEIKVSGPVDDLTASFKANVSDLLAYNFPIQKVDLTAKYESGVAQVESMTAQLGGGTVDLTGSYTPETKKGDFTGKIEAVNLQVLPIDRGTADVVGAVNGDAEFHIDGDSKSGKVTGSLAGLAVNDFEVGPGTFDATLTGDKVAFTAEAGSPQGYASVDKGSFDLATGEYGANVVADGFGLANLWQSLKGRVGDLDPQLEAFLGRLDGQATVEATVSGKGDQADLGLEYVRLANLTAGDSNLGEILAKGDATAEAASIEKLTWTVGDGKLEASGQWRKDGGVSGSGKVTKFDVGVVNAYVPEIPDFHAVVDGDFSLTGLASDPTISGNYKVSGVRMPQSTEDLPLAVNNGAFFFTEKALKTRATVLYDGIEAKLDSQVPESAVAAEPSGEAYATLTLIPRTIGELKKFLPGLEIDKSGGIVSGAMTVRGNRKNLDLTGEVKLGPDADGNAARLKTDSLETALTDVALSLTGEGNKLVMKGEGYSNQGGFVSLDGAADLGEILDEQPSTGTNRQRRDPEIPILGSATFDEFRIGQTIVFSDVRNGKPYKISANKKSEATLYGAVKVGGTVSQPVVSGKVEAGGLLVNLPSEFPQSTEAPVSAGGVKFDGFQLVALPKSRINYSFGNVDLEGTATVNGTTDNLDVKVPMRIDSGTFNLPTTRVTLQEGSTADVTVQGAADPRLDVNLKGKTRVTVREASNQYRSYVLNLEIKGNLLEANGVNLSGTSDPPGLSEDRIVAILGQQDLIESLAAGVLGQSGPNSLTESVYSLALPGLTGGITESLAKALHLDYLVLDYNPFDLGILRAGLTLGKGLTLEGSRQLTQTNFSPLKYEIQFAYRIPSGKGLLDRTRLTLGTNETVGWKIGLEYSVRF